MKKVIVTSGPRGAGKTTYIEKVQLQYPKVIILSRDKVLVELFGTTALSPYDGSHFIGNEVFWNRAEQVFAADNYCILFDYWVGNPENRKHLIMHLKSLGVEEVHCWHFVTPLEQCVEWFFLKPDVSGFSKRDCISDYQMYQQLAEDIESDGFDSIEKINPLEIKEVLL